jgi:hypothetical protein
MIDAFALIGTWKFTRDSAPAFLHFSHTQAFDYLQDGDHRQFLRLWYSLEEPTQIRFRSHLEESGWTCTIKMEGDSLMIHSFDSVTVCTRAETDEIPGWFIEQLAGA